jgi:uncharacterized protein with HEPN domain
VVNNLSRLFFDSPLRDAKPAFACYFAINPRTVWATVQSDLPLLKAQLIAAQTA